MVVFLAALVPEDLRSRGLSSPRRSAGPTLGLEVLGLARSLLAYEPPDGRLKPIDGHLRRDLDPDMGVDVEVLDVTDDEARALLLSIDPLAALALTQEQLHARLRELTPAASPELQAAWEATAAAAPAAPAATAAPPPPGPRDVPEQFLILVTCRDERRQVELLERFRREGWSARRCWCRKDRTAEWGATGADSRAGREQTSRKAGSRRRIIARRAWITGYRARRCNRRVVITGLGIRRRPPRAAPVCGCDRS